MFASGRFFYGRTGTFRRARRNGPNPERPVVFPLGRETFPPDRNGIGRTVSRSPASLSSLQLVLVAAIASCGCRSSSRRARCPMNRGTFFGRFSLGRLRGANRSVLDGKPFRCVRSHEPDVPYRPGVCGMVFRCAESVVVNCGSPFLGLRHGAHRENHVFLMRRGLF